MNRIRRTINVNDNIELTTFYALDSDHDVVCLNFRSTGGKLKGHMDFHAQLSRFAVQELIDALTDSLEDKADEDV